MRFGAAFSVLAGAGSVAGVVLLSSVFMRVPLPVYFVPTTLAADLHEVCRNRWAWAREVRPVGGEVTRPRAR